MLKICILMFTPNCDTTTMITLFGTVRSDSIWIFTHNHTSENSTQELMNTQDFTFTTHCLKNYFLATNGSKFKPTYVQKHPCLLQPTLEQGPRKFDSKTLMQTVGVVHLIQKILFQN